MVKSSADRLNKYTAKISGDVVKNRIDAQKDFMVANAGSHFDALAALENKVAGYCDANGINVMLKPFYMSLCRKVYKLMNKHTGTTLLAEVCITVQAWATRGLTEADSIAVILEANGYDASTCTSA